MRPLFFTFLRNVFAILIIANYSINTGAIAQNSSPESAQQVIQAEQQERQRIEQERKLAHAEYDAKRVQCYQRLAVTVCANAARDERNKKLSDLKRQETTLNDVQRKRRAAERLDAMEKRTAPQVQEEQALKRGQAIQDQEQREAQQQRKQQAQQSKLDQAAANAKPGAPVRQPKAAPAAGKPRAERDTKLKPAQRPGQAEKMEQSRRDADEREQALLKRRQELQKREQERKKPAAAPLPVPP